MMRAIAVGCICSLALLAQDSAEKATVTLHDPSRPARIRAHLLNGSITVRGADVKSITVEAKGRGRHETRESRAPGTEGMHRLDMSAAGMEVSEDNNLVNIKTSSFSTPTDLLITVPRRSSLELKSVNDGNIEVEQVDGEIDASDLNGKVVLKNVGGSVIAHSLNGSVVA